MRTFVRVVQILVLVAFVWSAFGSGSVAAATTDMTQLVGGSACSFAEGAGFVLGLAGIGYPPAAGAAIAIGFGVLIFC